jgi:hypothetical protein
MPGCVAKRAGLSPPVISNATFDERERDDF